MKGYQERVARWFYRCFEWQPHYTRERCFRFFEEAVELAQSLGVTRTECLKLIDYVYSRPVGEPRQEIGGVMTTLTALCVHERISLAECAEEELARVETPEIIAKIRAKQVSKRLLMEVTEEGR